MINTSKLNSCYFEILDSISDLVRVVDENDNILYSNSKKTDTLEKNFYKDKVKNKKNVFEMSKSIGNRVYSLKSFPIFDENENLAASVEIYRDITREKNLEVELNAQKKIMIEDIEFARRIQNKILPDKGNYDHVKVDYVYEPSNDLSGDIFDIINIDDFHIGMYIVDVAGHGIAASMMTVFIRQSMHTIAMSSLSPSEVLNNLQVEFKELKLEPSRYFTMFYGIYNIKTREFVYSNAGHNCIPFLFNEENLTMLVNYGLPILGFDVENNFSDNSVKLKSNDSILMYTDGIIEAKNTNGEEYGEDRIKLRILNRGENLLKEIVDDYNSFIDLEQKDDFALLLMEVK